MADHFDSKKFGSVVAIPFYVTDAATSQTDTDITLNQGDLAVMPTSGSVVGIAGRSTEASTGTGSIVFRAHNGGTEIANVGYPSITNVLCVLCTWRLHIRRRRRTGYLVHLGRGVHAGYVRL